MSEVQKRTSYKSDSLKKKTNKQIKIKSHK